MLSAKVGAKHVLLAVGLLGVAVGGVFYASQGSKPDFLCRMEVGCKERGLCAGTRDSCIAASDQDCASSEACAKDKECVQHGGRCVTEATRAAIATMAAQQSASKEVADYLKLAVHDYRQFGTSDPLLEAAEWGTAKFNGRTLPAAIIRANITITDRLAGERRPTCTVLAAINDQEFKMWRAKEGFMCKEKLGGELADWRSRNEFRATASWAQTPAVALNGTPPGPSP